MSLEQDILNDGIEGVNVFWSGDGNGMLGGAYCSYREKKCRVLLRGAVRLRNPSC